MDTILLSSDDEERQPPQKKTKIGNSDDKNVCPKLKKHMKSPKKPKFNAKTNVKKCLVVRNTQTDITESNNVATILIDDDDEEIEAIEEVKSKESTDEIAKKADEKTEVLVEEQISNGNTNFGLQISLVRTVTEEEVKEQQNNEDKKGSLELSKTTTVITKIVREQQTPLEKEDEQEEVEEDKEEEEIDYELQICTQIPKEKTGSEPIGNEDDAAEKETELTDVIDYSGDDELRKILRIEEETKITSTAELNNPVVEKFNEFLLTCSEEVKNTQYEERVLAAFPRIKNGFNKFPSLLKDKQFLDVLDENIKTARKSAAKAVCSFKVILDHINNNTLGDVEIEDKRMNVKLRRLEHLMKSLNKRIKKLETLEVDSSEDDCESSYIQLERYQKKMLKVYDKYCEILKKNPYSGRITHEKITFNYSNYTEINAAIMKKFKRDQFPTYYEVEKCIKKCLEKTDVKLSENELKHESSQCFKKLGEILQYRRRKELYEVHRHFIEGTEDPAENNEELASELKKSSKDSRNKMDEIVKKYAESQDLLQVTGNKSSSDENSVPDSDSD